MLSGISKHLLFGAYPALLLLVILAGHQSCSAIKNSTADCAPSCGNIHISYPFRLRTDHKSCGKKKYELDCKNNRTTLYLKNKGGKYYVQAIMYDSSLTAIRLVDADVQKHGCLSIPRHSFMMRSLNDHYYPYNVIGYSPFTLVFISCQNPIPCPRFNCVNTSSCKNGSISSHSSRHVEGYSYVMVAEDLYVSDVPDLCRINLIYEAASIYQKKKITNLSLIDVQDILASGFDVGWEQDEYKRRIGSPIRGAIDFLANRILAYVAIWPLSRYLQDSFWIQYDSLGQPRLKFTFYINSED